MKLTPEVIRLVRINLGLSQGKLARKADVSASLIGAIEREDRPLLPHIERSIFNALGLSENRIEDIVQANRNLRQAQ